MSDQTNIIRDYTKEIANLKYREEKLLKEAAELSNEIARLNRELVKKSKELEYLSYHDHLTKAFNRNYLDEFAVSDFKRARRYDEDLSIVYIDLDNFKLINDRYGHFYGDQVLKKFVEITSNNIRKYIDKLIRYGGDEFILILIKSNLDFAHKTVKRIEEILNQNNIFISYGIVNIKNFPNHDFEDLIKYAEDLMYKAKMEKKTNL
ncbi:MAG: GGDEF domain-containing protein [Caldisericia bacterium]|nr:GGDEF domain-containing protein [Caldisericia bacterium]